MTIPNILTLVRLALTPAIAWLAYGVDGVVQCWAFALFLVAMVTDVADGMIAKRYNQVSLLGIYLDPVVDKIILLVMFFVLADLGRIPMWMAQWMLARELLADGLRGAAATQGQVVGANFMGKTKASLQTGCIALGLGLPIVDPAGHTTRLVTTVTTGATLLLAWAFAFVFLWWHRRLLSASAIGGSTPRQAE